MMPAPDRRPGGPPPEARPAGELDWIPPPLRAACARRARLLLPLLAVASGILLAGAFPPRESWISAWAALIPLLVVCRFSSPMAAFRLGYLSGVSFWLPSLFWFAGLAHQGIPAAVAILGWIGLAAYCALYTAAFATIAAAGFARGGAADWRRNVAFLAVMPLAWAGLEYARTYAFTGFPWNPLGVSQYTNLAVIQVAEWGGVYGVSALVLLVNAGLMLTLFNFRGVSVAGAYRAHPELLLTLGAVAAAMVSGAHRVQAFRAARQPTLRIAIVQPAIPQDAKWDAAYVTMIYARLDALTRQACATQPAMVIWPETANPAPTIDDAECKPILEGLLTNGTPLLVGSTDFRAAPGNASPLVFNSSILCLPGGQAVQVYDKQHLTPFGEYAPVRWLIPFFERVAPVGWTSLTAGRTSTIFRLPDRPDAPFAALICFEDAFPDLARRAVRAGARFLVDQSNDAWFDHTSGPRQHLAHCVFRCVENRVPAVRATNTGISAFISSYGAIRTELNPMETGMLADTIRVSPPTLPPTFFAAHGRNILVPCATVAVLAFVLVIWRERRLKSQPTGSGGTV